MAELRGFQPEAVRLSCEYLAEPGAAGVLVLATGTGKTTIAGDVIKRLIQAARARGDWRCVGVWVERIALVDQMANSLRAHLPPDLKVGILQGSRRALPQRGGMGGDDVIVCSIDTIKRASRLSELLGGPRRSPWDAAKMKEEIARLFFLIVIDECHCGIDNKSYPWLYDISDQIARLGLTATPFSSDGKRGLGESWKKEIYQHSLADAIASGDLVSVKGYTVPLFGVKLGDIDFNKDKLTKAEEQQVETAMRADPVLHQIAVTIAEKVEKPALVFCSGTAHSADLAALLTKSHGLRAVHTDCYQDNKVDGVDGDRVRERDHILQQFRAGQIDVLCNFGLYATGADFPFLRSVVICSPKNRRTYVQIIGRVTRWCCAGAWNYGAGGGCTCGQHKQIGYLWDFYADDDKKNEHTGISGLVWALAPGADEEDAQALNDELEEGGGLTKETATQAAELVQKLAALRARAKAANAPVQNMDLLEDDNPHRELETRLRWAGVVLPPAMGEGASPVQLDMVAAAIWPDAYKHKKSGPWRQTLGANQAAVILRTVQDRKAKGLATLRQIGSLATFRSNERKPDGNGGFTVVKHPLMSVGLFKSLRESEARQRINEYVAEKQKG